MPTKRQARRKRAAAPRQQRRPSSPATARPNGAAPPAARTDAAVTASRSGPRALWRRRPEGLLPLLGIFVASALVYSWLGSKHELSDLFPDEVI